MLPHAPIWRKERDAHCEGRERGNRVRSAHEAPEGPRSYWPLPFPTLEPVSGFAEPS